MAYTLSQPIFLANAGLAPSAQLFDTAGANVGGAVTLGFLDRGNGLYLWTYSSFPDGFRGGVDISVAGEKLVTLGINPEEAENTDAKTSSRMATFAVGLPTVTVVSPVLSSGSVQIVRGDDYAAADGRALTFDFSDPTGTSLPSLTGATVRFKTVAVPVPGAGSGLNVTGTVVTATGTTRTVRFDLTSAQTRGLLPGAHSFDVEATLSSARVITLLQGQCIVLSDA